ncbi:MAG: DEAD/DEAH box helicase [Bacteroidetes bacterium]|nr:DEAD/DEAH box helicase [Bacteroidota bacterium]
MTFSDFGFSSEIIEGLEAMGFQNPTPIQEQAIPVIQEGKDLIGCAQTGTGKTAAFLLPILNKIHQAEKHDNIKVLIIVPTRELAIQIDNQIQGLAYYLNVSSIAVYGGGDGSSWDIQKKAIQTGADIMVATPGRLIAHINQEYVDLTSIKHVILDEADRMLDMGFNEDITRIIKDVPKERQTLLFSATMPKKIRELSQKILSHPEEISLAISKPAERVVQGAFLTFDGQKNSLIAHLLQAKTLKSVLIFCSRKSTVKELNRDLKKLGIQSEAIHSDLEQHEREKLLLDYRNRTFPVLIATDILSRGIDIEDIDLVMNYDVPRDAEDYVHRIGRTARASSKGIAFTLINEDDMWKFHQIERLIGSEVRKIKLPPHLGSGPDYDPQGSKNRGKSYHKKPKKVR